MPHRTRGWVLGGWVGTAAALIGLAAYFAVVGLATAASVAGPVGVLVGLGIGMAQLLGRPAAAQEPVRRRWPEPNCLLDPREQARLVDRDDELRECHSLLKAKGFLVIHGLDGQGKTTLAQMYATKFQKEYDLMWLVGASQKAGVSTELESLAGKSGVVTAAEPQAVELRYELRKALAAQDRWLLIFDDVRDWASIQDYILPFRRLAGHIIATTQDVGAVRDLKPHYLLLKGLPLAASTEFLRENIRTAAEADIQRLAHDFDGLPFALDYAAKEYGATVIPGRRETPAKDAVGELHRLWKRPLDQLQEQAESSLAYSLLEVCSLFASGQISETVLTSSLEDNTPVNELRGALTDPTRYANLVKILQHRSFVGPPVSQAITVHTLLQAYLRENMKKSSDRFRGRLSVAIGLLKDAFKDSWYADNQPRCGFALPHAEACLEIAEQNKIASADAAILMIRMAHYHRTRGDIFKAQGLHERALKMRETVFGHDSPMAARQLINIGMVLKEIGEPDEAIQRYERSLSIFAGAEPPDEEDAAICRDNLGLAWTAKGQYSKAIDLHVQAYDFWVKQKREPRHSNVAQILGNMGIALYLLGDLAQSEKMLQRAVDIGREALKIDFSKLDLAEMLHNHGQVLRAGGGVYDAWRAKPHLKEALELRSDGLGEKHLAVIETRTALSRVFRREGEYDTAEEELKIASDALQEIRESGMLGFGPAGSPDLSSKYKCALLIAEGELRFAQGNYKDAKHSLVDAQKLAGGPPNIELAELTEALARVYNHESPGTGEPWLQRAAEIRAALKTARAQVREISEEVD